MKVIVVTFLILILGTAHAARIEDVQVLDVKYVKEQFEVKFRLKEAKDNSFFTVQIVREDEKAFEKMALVLKKKNEKDFKLDLNIPSFSPQSGSLYRSPYVTFVGSAEGESLLGN